MGLIVGRPFFRSVFSDFEVELPITTQYLFYSYTPLVLSIVSTLVVLSISIHPMRNKTVIACVVGALLWMACLLVLFLPLVSLWQNLH